MREIGIMTQQTNKEAKAFRENCDDTIESTTISMRALVIILSLIKKGMMTEDNGVFTDETVRDAVKFQYEMYEAACEMSGEKPREINELITGYDL